MKQPRTFLAAPGCLSLLLGCTVLGQAFWAPAAPAPKRVAACLAPYVQEHTLAGAVILWADKERVLGLEAVGYADVATQQPLKADALFWIASMSKPMTASALMMLVDEGKVKLSEPVETYLPEFKGQWLALEEDSEHQLLKRPAHPITVEEVLAHTSGLPFLSRVEHHIDTLPLRAAAVSYALSPLKSQPGTHYSYSNCGLNTAGRLIEAVSGMPYEDFMARRLFGPLGMGDTTFRPSKSQLKRLAKSYKPNASNTGLEQTPISQLSYPLDSPQRCVSPAGGYFSTAKDLSIFCRMILNGGVYKGKRYLSEAALQEMTSLHTGELAGKNANGYGLGWSVSGRPRTDGDLQLSGSCGHGGAYSTDMQIDFAHQLVTILLVQHAGYPGTNGGKILPAVRQAVLEASGR